MAKTEQPLKIARDIVLDPCHWITEWKRRTSRKVIGTFGMHVPHELIHAAGMQPIVLQGGDKSISPRVDQVMPGPPYCVFARGLLDLAMTGKLDFLDGLVMHECCTTAGALIDLIPRYVTQISWFRPLWFPVPLKAARARQWLLEELEGFKHSLEEFAGQKITEMGLRRSIAVYNYNRTLMKSLYDLRRSRPSAISAQEMHDILLSGMIIPKEEHSSILERLLHLLENRETPRGSYVKLLVSGSLCAVPWRWVMELIDDIDAAVVDDDLYAGSRYFLAEVRDYGDPLEALGESYMKMIAPCPTRWDPDNKWGDYLVRMASRVGAEAVINVIVRNCDPHEIYYPRVRAALIAAGIPELGLHVEPAMSTARAMTQLEALLEQARS